MAAAQEVFDVYELLENIIVRLPREDIRKSQGVCSQWQQLIRRSVPIREARCLDVVVSPLRDTEFDSLKKIRNHPTPALEGMQALVTFDDIDYDENESGQFREFFQQTYISANLNPCILANAAKYESSHHFSICITELLDSDLAGIGSQYVSEPPVSIVYLKLSKTWWRLGYGGLPSCRGDKGFCSLRIATGVTVQDVVDCSELMLGSKELGFEYNLYLVSYLNLGSRRTWWH